MNILSTTYTFHCELLVLLNRILAYLTVGVLFSVFKQAIFNSEVKQAIIKPPATIKGS